MSAPLPRDKRQRARDVLRERLARNRFSHFITLATNDPMVGTWRMRSLLKEWDARVNRFLVGPKWHKRPDERLLWFAFLEKPEANPHWHLLAEVDPQLAEKPAAAARLEEFELQLGNIWRSICATGSADVAPYRDEGAIFYATKEQTREDLLASFVSHLEFIR